MSSKLDSLTTDDLKVVISYVTMAWSNLVIIIGVDSEADKKAAVSGRGC